MFVTTLFVENTIYMKKTSDSPTNSELEILTILWQNGASTVREVHNVLEKSKKTGYTTTLKIVQNMYEKKFLERAAQGNTHKYTPVIKENIVQKNMLNNFVNLVFRGSSKNLIMSSLGSQKTTSEDIKEIRRILEELEQKEEKNG